ncbi:MAG: hypothetical protein C5B50_07815 [Verrucomicrobia bacterium]|nr:MAG: hypothetical protein C5B50_07815 [Verrucomicrobiota bacterium]
MAETRLAQLATSPLLQNFAITASQKAIRPVGQFIAPICEVPDLTFRYKKYTEQNRYRVPNTKRQPGSPATVLGFAGDDANQTLEPNALDFPIPNAEQLSDEGLQFAIMEAQSVLADASALALENEIVSAAQTAASNSTLSKAADFTNDNVDPIAILDDMILAVAKGAKNGAPVKVLFGTTKFKQFRNNANVKRRYIVSAGVAEKGGGKVGTVSPSIADVGGLLMTNPEVELSMMVIDQSAPGQAENIQFLLDTMVIVFASNSTPNRMDPSFMKTFARMGGFFRSGSYTTVDQRDQVLKMDWTTLPVVTNTAAVGAIKS